MVLDGKIFTDAIAVQGDYVYVAGQDFAASGTDNGVIERIPKMRGRRVCVVVSPCNRLWSRFELVLRENFDNQQAREQ